MTIFIRRIQSSIVVFHTSYNVHFISVKALNVMLLVIIYHRQQICVDKRLDTRAHDTYFHVNKRAYVLLSPTVFRILRLQLTMQSKGAPTDFLTK